MCLVRVISWGDFVRVISNSASCLISCMQLLMCCRVQLGGGGGCCDAVNWVDRGENEMHVNEMCIRERVLAGDTV